MIYEAAQQSPRPILVGAYLLFLGLGAFFPVDRLFGLPARTTPEKTPAEPDTTGES